MKGNKYDKILDEYNYYNVISKTEEDELNLKEILLSLLKKFYYRYYYF